MRILMIEDNKDLCDGVIFHLEKAGYKADACYTGENALYYALSNSYDLIILDRMLPAMDGLTILRHIREKKVATPVIMVTAMDGVNDRIGGLDAGADDYLVKPFLVDELLARVRALLRRPPSIENTEILLYNALSLNTAKQILSVGEKNCTLSKKETELLEYFMRNKNQVLPRETILSHVWGSDNFVENGNLDNYIHFLRRRLKTLNSSVQIKTIHRIGYCLEDTVC